MTRMKSQVLRTHSVWAYKSLFIFSILYIIKHCPIKWNEMYSFFFQQLFWLIFFFCSCTTYAGIELSIHGQCSRKHGSHSPTICEYIYRSHELFVFFTFSNERPRLYSLFSFTSIIHVHVTLIIYWINLILMNNNFLPWFKKNTIVVYYPTNLIMWLLYWIPRQKASFEMLCISIKISFTQRNCPKVQKLPTLWIQTNIEVLERHDLFKKNWLLFSK